jgi:hypothetical protein
MHISLTPVFNHANANANGFGLAQARGSPTELWQNIVSANSSHMDLEGLLGKRPHDRDGPVGRPSGSINTIATNDIYKKYFEVLLFVWLHQL